MASSLPFSGIYSIICLSNRHWYVGQAQDIGLRWAVHRANLRKGNHHCSHLQRAWEKYGENKFDWAVVERCSKEELDEMEQWWMDSTPDLFNSQRVAGSARGFKVAESTKRRISLAAKRIGTNPEEKRRRSERAKRMHAEGRITYHEKKKRNFRTCKYCGEKFELQRHPKTGAWRQNKICHSCKEIYNHYTPSIRE